MINNEVNFKIQNRNWKLYIVDPHDPLLWVNNTAKIGSTWPMARKIAISNELDYQRTEDVIAHELVHAVMSETSIDDPKEYSEELLAVFYENFHIMLNDLLNEVMGMLQKIYAVEKDLSNG